MRQRPIVLSPGYWDDRLEWLSEEWPELEATGELMNWDAVPERGEGEFYILYLDPMRFRGPLFIADDFGSYKDRVDAMVGVRDGYLAFATRGASFLNKVNIPPDWRLEAAVLRWRR